MPMTAEVIAVSVPEYTVDKVPDYLGIGRRVDEAIESNFTDRKFVYRAIGKDDHPQLTLDELVSVVQELGTDKYDPERQGVSHEEFSAYDYDMQAGSFEIRDGRIVVDEADRYPTLFGDTIRDFYEGAPVDRGHPVRVDILMLYDPGKVEPAPKVDPRAPGNRLAKYLYRFKDPDDKPDALLGVVKILR